MIIIPGLGPDYPKDANSPFWQDVARMQPGSFVKYQSIARTWHVFRVIEGPAYGRKDGVGLSVVVKRISTGEIFTMPPNRLRSCPPAFAAQDNKPIPKSESWRDN